MLSPFRVTKATPACCSLAARSRCAQVPYVVRPAGPEPSCLPAVPAPAGETVGAALAGIYIPLKIIMGRKVLVLIGASI